MNIQHNITSFLLGVLSIISIGAVTNTFNIVQPQKPIHTDVKSFRAMLGMENDIKKYIDQKVKEGYIVKSVTMMDDETWSKGIVVMEKY
jgi:hypothetical protein